MADVYLVEGGTTLHGEVTVSGAKNSALKLLATALLASGTHTLGRVPRIADLTSMIDVLGCLGVRCEWLPASGNGSRPGGELLTVHVPDELGIEAPYEYVSKMRASIAVLGPLLARQGRARVALPGGCNLGPRRIDLHLKGLEQLGAKIDIVHGYLEASAPKLVGAEVELDYPSHGATENLVMAAVLADGRTVIRNASKEPEIVDLIRFLQGMGAQIAGGGTSVIEIDGVDELSPTTMDVMPDRLEAGTYLFAAAATGGDVTVRDIVPAHLGIVVEKLLEAGCEVELGDDRIRVISDGKPKPVDISTLPYPGFPTDLQPMAVAMLTVASGLSVVTENIFDGRFMFVDELARMGADARVEGHYAVVRGPSTLTAAPVQAPDLRGGAALVLAGLLATGTTVIEGVEHIDRGYEDLPGRFGTLGASIQRVPADSLTLT